MKKFRLSAALLLLALVLALVPAAFAQDGTFGASQEDFDLWTAANTALTTSAASIEFTASLAATGLGESTDDVTADVSGTGAFDLTDMENPVLQLDITGTTTQGTTETPINMNLRIVDGVVYTNEGDGWTQEPLEDQLSSLTGELGGMTGTEVDPSDLTSDESMTEAMNMFGDLNIEEFVSLDVSDESGARKFSLSFDVAGFIGSPAIASMMSGFMGMSGGADAPEMSDEQMEQMSQMMGALFGDATVTFDEWVDAETQTLNRAVLDIDFPLEGIMGPGAGVTFNFDAKLSHHGEPVTVEAPEGAVPAESDS
jgi:hypothetical protein